MANSVLKLFYLMFKSDSRQLRDDADKVQRSLKKTEDGLKSFATSGDHLKASISQIGASIHSFAASLLSASVIIAGLRHTNEYVTELTRTSQELGINIHQLEVWNQVIKSSGGSSEAFTGSLKHMTDEIQKAKIGLGSESVFALRALGINFHDATGKVKNFLDILPELSDKFSKIDKMKGLMIGKRIGLDEQTILLLQKGRGYIDQLIVKQKELAITTQKDSETTLKFNQQWENLKFAFLGVFEQVNSFTLPILGRFFEYLEKTILFLRTNESFVKSFFVAIGGAISAYLLPPLLRMAASAAVIYAPFLGIAAAITGISTALALVSDDIKNFREGNLSVIGELSKKWPVIGIAANKVYDTISALWDLIKDGALVVSDILTFNFKKAWDDLSNAVIKFIKRIEEIYPITKPIIDLLVAAFKLGGEIIMEIWDGVLDTISSVFKFIQAAALKVKDTFESIKGKMGISSKIETSAIPANSILSKVNSTYVPDALTSQSLLANAGNKTTTVTVDNLTIQTQATDANGISQDIRGALVAQLRQATNNFDDGINA